MGTRYLSFEIRLDEIERTPAGGLRVPAYISRTGVQVYQTADGLRREYRSEDEVFSSATLDSFRGAAITMGHPRNGMVRSDNWHNLAVGHVGDDLHADGSHTACTLYIDRQDAVAEVEARRLVELSAGYQTQVVDSPGTSPDGETYDALQTDIRGNHVALLPPGHGRAGPEVRVRLDSLGDEILTQEAMMAEKAEGKPTLADVLAELKADVAEVVEAELAKKNELQGRVDELQARVDELQTALDEAQSADRLDALVNARLELVEKARRIDKDVDVQGKSDREIMLDVMGTRVSVDCTDDYLRGAFEARAEMTPEQHTDAAGDLAGPNKAPAPVSKLDEAEEQFNTKRAVGFARA